jgi:hypothetical protein
MSRHPAAGRAVTLSSQFVSIPTDSDRRETPVDQFKHNVGPAIVFVFLATLVGCVSSKVAIVPQADTYEAIPAQSGIPERSLS